MTGKDLGHNAGVVEQAKFEHSPLGKIFNKWFEKEDKKEGLLKGLKTTESKNKEQLDEIEYQGERKLDMIDKHEKNNSKQLKNKKSN